MSALLLLLIGCAGDKPGPGVGESGTDSAPESGGAETGEPAVACAEQRGERLEGEVCVSAAPCSWSGEQSYEYLGWAVASGGDVDGDGREDALLASPAWDAPSSDGLGSDAGRVLLLGGAALAEPGDGALATWSGVGYAENLGTNAAIVGDVTGDGLADMLLGAHGDDVAAENAGAAWLVAGSAEGFGDARVDEVALIGWTGESEYARVGRSLAGGEDVDGDGLADLLIGGELTSYDGEDEDFREGRAYLVRGAASLPEALADADAALDGPDAGGGAGKTGALGDLDGDGYADALIAAPYGCSWAGCVYALPGGAATARGAGSLADAPVVLEGEATYDAFGWQVVVSDLDGDGADEVVTGAPLSDRAYGSAGAVWIHRGGADFFAGPELGATLDGPWDDWQLGAGLTAGGDLDGDGREELLIGAVAAWTGLHTKAGRYYLFGGAETLPASLAEARAVLHGAAVKDYLGSAAALGDLDADGRDDLLVGSGYVNSTTAYDLGAAWVFWGSMTPDIP